MGKLPGGKNNWESKFSVNYHGTDIQVPFLQLQPLTSNFREQNCSKQEHMCSSQTGNGYSPISGRPHIPWESKWGLGLATYLRIRYVLNRE